MADVKSTLLSNMPVVIAGAVAILAAGAWIAFWMSPDEDHSRVPKAVEAKAGKSGEPPMRALPAPGTDLLPPLRTPPAEPTKPEAPPVPTKAAEPAKSAPAPAAKVAVAPPLPVTAPAQPAEKAPPAPAPKRVEKSAPEPAAVSSGRYVGNISGGDAGGLTLVISVEGSAIRGTASLAGSGGGGVCDGDYPMQGSARGGKVELRATKMGGRASDCPLTLTLTVDGNRMTGSSGGGGSVQLTQR